mmetsp:Transcript_36830/g.72422  ORF Transcript_36830/g.72422 Transcript_36830/m.72422 type:complete len:81 (+) Transcript_36830:129-371(+)
MLAHTHPDLSLLFHPASERALVRKHPQKHTSNYAFYLTCPTVGMSVRLFDMSGRRANQQGRKKDKDRGVIEWSHAARIHS